MNPEEEWKQSDSAEVQMIRLRYQSWLADPITQAYIKALTKQRDKFIAIISNSASNSNFPSEELRYMANGLKTMDAVIALTNNPDSLIKLLM